MSIENLMKQRHVETSIEGIEEMVKASYTEKTPDSWKDLFYFEMMITGKIHVVPAATVCLSIDAKKGSVFICPIGTFKYMGETDLLIEVMNGRKTFPVTALERELY